MYTPAYTDEHASVQVLNYHHSAPSYMYIMHACIRCMHVYDSYNSYITHGILTKIRNRRTLLSLIQCDVVCVVTVCSL
jgi:hypothetical protein